MSWGVVLGTLLSGTKVLRGDGNEKVCEFFFFSEVQYLDLDDNVSVIIVTKDCARIYVSGWIWVDLNVYVAVMKVSRPVSRPIFRVSVSVSVSVSAFCWRSRSWSRNDLVSVSYFLNWSRDRKFFNIFVI